ncbi:uncharacterized protein LOC127288771 [Leptopilina boulardi]|uniref:uncharacterized protein LOC127288771 n=1 Tax=Leptopilina boulardi TaxID=63433 RepID=UPI0021F523DA|nr:uncharacterized protein LOC127288771 [Leptopilina boulardi]
MGGGRGIRSRPAWIPVFICLATKAVHLEVVSEYSTAAFLAAFDRFCSRRNKPSKMHSDRGTNFQGADKELRQAFRELRSDPSVQARLANDGIAWQFIPPAAPHFGGLWEAGVKSMKHHLIRILGAHTPTFEELSTLVCRIEACMNSRPIGPINDDVESLDTLTPGHFLVYRNFTSVPRPSLDNIPENRLSRWQLMRQLLEQFWREWSNDYIRSCQHRTKWQNRTTSLKVGQIVLLRNDNLPPTKWNLGRITRCHPGSDGLTRVVSVKTATSEYTRPISKLALFPINIDE